MFPADTPQAGEREAAGERHGDGRCPATAAAHDRSVERRQWRITVMTHLAETREQAIKDMAFGLQHWVDYSHHVLPASPFPIDEDDPLSWGMENKVLLVGTPDDAIREIERIQDKTGGFGTFLLFAHNFAPWDAAKRSYELFARYVTPHFTGANQPRQDSYNRARAGHDKFQADVKQAVSDANAAYRQSKE